MAEKPKSMVFQPATEPRENAFKLLIPKDWLIEGGIYRADLMHQRISAQSIEAKCDLSIKSDSAGSIMLRLVPEFKYCDMRYNMAGMLFPPGSNYQGMLVCPILPSPQLLVQMLFPWAHPQATQAQLLVQNNLPLMAERQRRRTAAMGIPYNFQYDAGEAIYTYFENGVQYKERAYTAIENLGQLGGGMWSNKGTFYMRAPVAEYEAWEPILQMIYSSVQISPNWFAQEAASQQALSGMFIQAQQAEMARAQKALEFQRQMQQIDREIAASHQMTNAEINNDFYLVMTNQEEYKNPFTGETELGSNQWNYRWTNPSGEIFYSDTEADNPNYNSNRSDWQMTQVRPRFPN
jgi:hypothetical protein